MSTVNLSFVDLPKVAPTKRTLSKGAKEARASLGIHKDLREVKFKSTGPEVVRFDTQRMMNWILITNAGYYTYIHHDSNGLLTWAMVGIGSKCWGTWDIKDHTTTAKGQWEAHMLKGFHREKSDGDLHNALLTRGTVMRAFKNSFVIL
jgi:hypothetical protein